MTKEVSSDDTRAIDVVIVGMEVKISIKDAGTGAELASIVLTPDRARAHNASVARAVSNILEWRRRSSLFGKGNS